VHVVFSHWSASWPALACYVVLAGGHLAGLRRARPAAGTPGTARELRHQAITFQAGLLLGLLTLVSPVGYLSDVYIWVRALQLLLLALVVPGLIVLGAPWPAFAAVIRPRAAGRDRRGQDPVPSWRRSRPVLAVVVANVVWLCWQLPGPFDAVHGNSLVAWAQHATCLLAGVVLWLQLIGSRPFSPAARPLRRLALVVGTVGVMTVLGMVLVFGSNVLYPVYANSAHHLMTVLDDQQLSGAVLWMGSLLPLITVAVALLMRWLSEEDSVELELSADLDRLLLPRKNAWSARPGSR
jgi:cytochrome c oxidase assembly factor CtaG